ncbi:E3 ubiquitin-protein ligase CCNB1IP1 isoform X2 [Hyperolius riggenbachi]|uniref:E3 ubiquitin-protein ligase CCNB1IP1 isoform X2 n=1 Tax=Hyperolius riggenbachi TaxID=752182 RepID=UPI0035A2C4CF
MSLCDDLLLCNFPKCRVKLSGYAWVTSCSHIFCEKHGDMEFSQSPATCPACNNTLSGRMDIARTELSPSEEQKAIILSGLRPEIVLDICSRALAFWTYQVYHERLYQQYNYSKAEQHLKQMEKLYSHQIQSKESELAGMKGNPPRMRSSEAPSPPFFCSSPFDDARNSAFCSPLNRQEQHNAPSSRGFKIMRM